MKLSTANEVTDKIAPRFIVTALEFEKAAELEAELNRLDLQLTESRRRLAREQLPQLREAYRADPTAENLRALKEAEHYRSLMSQPIHSLANVTLRQQISAIYQKFVNSQVIPWARPIVERGLALERARFELVVEAENEKHLALTGHPMCQSCVVTAARTPFTNVERIHSSLKHTDAAILRQHLFRALENFR